MLTGAVVAVAVLVLVAAVALAASLSGGGSPSPNAPSVAAPTSGHGGRGGQGTGTGHSRGGTSAPRSTSGSGSHTQTTSGSSTTTTLAAVPGAAPQIAALSPSTGAAGQTIQVAGANFLSASGQIIATFNGQVAPTQCPAQTTCTVTVPPITGASSAQVIITTASGTSNAVTFTYS
ncbi:MAG TPA: IPT/TIG domain-containing protein [Acidimicrobiales bacterium]|nr:IPT/TIG domain-containing protein [Acidimicrobiales bacterium]